MADTIARLKLDSGEFDSKIKRAVTGLQQMEDECRKVGGTLAVLEKDQLDYVKALGQMQTVATTTKGKLAELTSAYTELRVQYNRLTDEEKKGDFGKALNSSLAQLKTRIDDTKKELGEVNHELGNTSQASEGAGSAIEQFTSKLGLNIKQLVGWATAIAAAKAALDIAKDAFFASETNVDEWGRTIQSAEAVYTGFLTAINTGDISGYLNNIDSIVAAARQAYNELDRLGTMKTIQTPQMSRQESENQRLRTMLMTGRYIAPLDGRKNAEGLKTGDLLSPDQMKNIEKHLQGGMQTIVDLTKNELKQTGKAIDAYYNSLAKQNGMSLKEFRKGTSTWEEFKKRIKGADELNRWKNEHSKYNSLTRTYDYTEPIPEQLKQYKGWDTFRVDKMGQNSYNDLVGLIRQQQQQSQQLYGQIGQMYRTVNRAEGVTVRGIMGGGSGGGNSITGGGLTSVAGNAGAVVSELVFPQGTTESMDELRKELALFNQMKQSATTTQEYMVATQGIEDVKSRMSVQEDALRMGVSTETMQEYMDIQKKAMDEMTEKALGGFSTEGIKAKEGGESEGKKAWENMQKTMTALSGVMSGVSAVGSGLQAMGIQLDEDVLNVFKGIQGAISVVQGVISIINAMSLPSEAANTIATNSNTVALGTLAAAIHSNTASRWLKPFATGGVVPHAAGGLMIPGNDYSDRTPVLVSSGELILNKFQQNALAARLEGNPMQNMHFETRVSAEDIRFILSAASSRQNNTEYLNFDFV